jgi:ribokinase
VGPDAASAPAEGRSRADRGPAYPDGVPMPSGSPALRVAVVGHVEWIEFGRVERVPTAGMIAHATDPWEEPGGGGGVAAAQLAKLAGACDLFTAVGGDEVGARMVRELGQLGIDVHAAPRDEPTRRAVTLVDDEGERTIVTLGARLEPAGSDPLPWDRLPHADAVYVTAGDPAAFAFARRARVMVVASRALDALVAADTPPDALVGSRLDPAERFDPATLPWPVPLVVLTEGREGGSFVTAAGEAGSYAAAPLPGPVVDTYGGGDSFAAALTYALGEGRALPHALGLAAACGAAAVTGRGPYAGQLARDASPED